VLVPRGDRPRDLVLAHDGADVREEILEDRVLALRQLQRLAVDQRALASEVHHQRSVLDHARADRTPAPRERRDARDELFGCEGLREVIVGADREAEHAIGHRVARGEHQHGLLAATRAQLAQPAESIHPRQPDVQHEEVHLGDAKGRIRRFRARDRVDHVARAAQRFGEAVGQQVVVFDDEHAHGAMMSDWRKLDVA